MRNSSTPIYEDVLQIYESCLVDFELSLQIWNIDDRIMKDRDHRKRPNMEFQILKVKEQMNEVNSVFGHLTKLQNKYQDFAQLIQCNEQIIFMNGKEKITVYDVLKKEKKHHRIKDHSKNTL